VQLLEILFGCRKIISQLLIPSTVLHKVKVKLFLCFNKNHKMKTNGEVVAQPHTLCSIVGHQFCAPSDLYPAPTGEVVRWTPYPDWKYRQRGKSLLLPGVNPVIQTMSIQKCFKLLLEIKILSHAGKLSASLGNPISKHHPTCCEPANSSTLQCCAVQCAQTFYALKHSVRVKKSTKCLQACGWAVWTILQSSLKAIHPCCVYEIKKNNIIMFCPNTLFLYSLHVQPDDGYFS
jgi:hypothetical protein